MQGLDYCMSLVAYTQGGKYRLRARFRSHSIIDNTDRCHVMFLCAFFSVREVCPSFECHIRVGFKASHDGRAGKVHVDPCTCTIDELRCAIARQLHLPPASVILHWPCGSRLSESAAPGYTLARAGFPTSGTIQLDVNVQSPKVSVPHTAGAVQIFVKYKKSHTISIVPSVDTVHTLQTKIWNKVGLPVERQWLQCCKPLPYDNSIPLCEYGIVGGMTIFLNLRPTNNCRSMYVENLQSPVPFTAAAAEHRISKRRFPSVEDTSDMSMTKRLKGCNISHQTPAISSPILGKILGQHLMSPSCPAFSAHRPVKRPYKHVDCMSDLNPNASATLIHCTPHMKRFKKDITNPFCN